MSLLWEEELPLPQNPPVTTAPVWVPVSGPPGACCRINMTLLAHIRQLRGLGDVPQHHPLRALLASAAVAARRRAYARSLSLLRQPLTLRRTTP